MNRSLINPAILQQTLDSATSAARVAQTGQAQYFTPPPLARILAAALPRSRWSLCDLTCGRGDLLRGAAGADTEHLLGCDIDPSGVAQASRLPQGASRSLLTADLLHFAPLLDAVQFRTDLFVLNPPWSIPWPAPSLAYLASSDVPTVTDTYRSLTSNPHPNANPNPAIDSTLATFLLALHFLTDDGEALLICHTPTAHRLILGRTAAPGVGQAPSPVPAAAPAADPPDRQLHSVNHLAAHLWAHLILPGNPCTGETRGRFGTALETSVLYFTKRRHDRPHLTVRLDQPWHPSQPPGDLEAAVSRITDYRRTAGLALNLHSRHNFHPDSPKLWQACVAEHARRQKQSGAKNAAATGPDTGPSGPCGEHHHLWLAPDGTIQCHLSQFEQHAGIPGGYSRQELIREATVLHALQGQTPCQLIPQRAQRDLLLRAVGRTVERDATPAWRVDPKLRQAVLEAVAAYHSDRAPLYPLPKIQRLGYLDEEDSIRCIKDFAPSSLPSFPSCPSAKTLFVRDQTYPLRTKSVPIKRLAERYNPLTDEMEKIEYTGAELATFITAEDDTAYTFMEARLLQNPAILIDPTLKDGREQSTIQVHFTLQQLAEHFQIPEVPDISVTRPDAYRHNVAALTQLCTLLS